jgi:hypothetical protein
MKTIHRSNPYTEHAICAPPARTIVITLRKTKSPFDTWPKGLAGAQITENLCSGDTSGAEIAARKLL